MILSESPKIQAFNMDCMDFMRDKPDNYYELAIVDPPYGINIAEWDDSIPSQTYFDELDRVSVNQIIWGGNYFSLPHTEAWICWDKTHKFNRNIDMAAFELAWTSLIIKAVFCRFTYCGNFYGWEHPHADYKKPPKIHPTQKPVELYSWTLQNYAKPGDKILDTHGGSFSSAIACHQEGFDLDICELDEDYFNDAIKRFKLNTVQEKLF